MSDDALVQALLHFQQALGFGFQHTLHGYTGPARDDFGDIFRVDHVVDVALRAPRSRLLGKIKLDLQPLRLVHRRALVVRFLCSLFLVADQFLQFHALFAQVRR